jgi:hypothetical protein
MRAEGIGAPGLILPDVKVYEVSEGGAVELREDWSKTGRENVKNALLQGLRNRNYRVKSLRVDETRAEEMIEIQALYRAVYKSIQLHSDGTQPFPQKKKAFDYSLGPLEQILQRCESDSVIFVRGLNQVYAAGKRTFLSIALADSAGNILWYGVSGSRGGHDLREPEGAAGIVGELLSSFPEAGG